MKKITLFMLIIFCLYTPAIQTVQASEQSGPEINSEAAILVDSETGAVLYEKNADKMMYPASLTKIATAIYAIESGNLDDLVTVSEAAANTDGTRVYLEKGEQVTLKKLIQGMLINSGNDAATAIADHLDANMEQFEKRINEYLLTKVKVKNTHFTNPHGLFDEKHYTTAKDLAMITDYALKNAIFRDIYGTKELKWEGKSWDTTLITHHLMLKGEIPYETVIGGKTGYVPESKFTLATTAQRDNMELTAIVLKGRNDKEVYNDTKNLLDYGFDQYNHTLISKSDTFHLADKYFTTGFKDILITVPKTQYQKTISKSGQLQIKNNNGEIIQSVSLIERHVSKRKPDQQIAEHTENKTMGYYGKYAAVLLFIGGIIIGARKIIKR